MRRVVFLGAKSIGYHCLQYLIEQSEPLDIEVVAVLTNQKRAVNPSSDLKALSETHRIPVYESLAALESAGEIDFLISVQYHEILKQQHIDRAQKIAVNLHMAPLPEYRGCNQFSFAIVEGRAEFGTTLHRLEAGIDDGDIISEKRFPIPEGCTVAELYELTLMHSKTLFEESIGSIIRGAYDLTPQAELEAERGTAYHYRNEIEQLKRIDLNWSPEQISRHIRATYMPGFDPPYAIVDGRKIEFSLRDISE